MAKAYVVYGDTSGQGQSGDLLCVTGVASTTSRWLKFETRWLTLLNEYGITPPFHMTDFANGAGQYAGFRSGEKDPSAFLSKAIKVIHLSTNKCFAVSVAVDDLRDIQRIYDLPDGMNGDHPYHWCTLILYQQIKKWLEQHTGRHDRIGVVFESGDFGQRAFPQRLQELYPTIEPPDFAGKPLAPLQAADLLAYEFRKGVIYRSKGRIVRTSFSEILRRLPMDWKYYSRQHLLRLCELGRFPKRPETELQNRRRPK